MLSTIEYLCNNTISLNVYEIKHVKKGPENIIERMRDYVIGRDDNSYHDLSAEPIHFFKNVLYLLTIVNE